MQTTEERLSRVELALENFIVQVGSALDRLSIEMQEFKEEMRRNAERRDREMQEFKEEMNKRWGDLAHKMGTIVEDIIYPGIEPVLAKYFKCEPMQAAIRMRKRRGPLRDEFDIVVVSEKYAFLVEVKSSPNHNHVMDLADKIVRFQQLFPEYASKQLIMILAGLSLPDDVVRLCTEKSYYALGYRKWDYLDLLNFAELPVRQ